jgi:hypothetical protein
LLRILNVGDRLDGRVVKVLRGSQVLMSFQGTELIASTALPLARGELIRGVVQSKGPPLVLKIDHEGFSEKTKLLVRFRSLVSQYLQTVDDHPLIALLKIPGMRGIKWTEPLIRWLNASAMGDGTPMDPQRVWAAIIHGGVFYERKLRQWSETAGKHTMRDPVIDLKGVALKLLTHLESREEAVGGQAETVKRSLESLIGKIELFQTANWLARQEGLGLIFQIPLRFGGSLETADLLVSLSQRKKGIRDGFRIVLLLNLEGLGRFHIDTTLSQKGVTAAIGVDREETVGLVRSMMGELKAGLENQGLTVLGVECVQMEIPPTKTDFFTNLLGMDEVEGLSIRV